MVVIMVVIVTMVVIVIVVVIVAVAFEEFRLDSRMRSRSKALRPSTSSSGDLRALGPVQLGVRVDAADARLDFAQFLRRDQIGLVDQDDVGERDLVLGLGRVLEPVVEPFGVGDRDHRVEPGLARRHSRR